MTDVERDFALIVLLDFQLLCNGGVFWGVCKLEVPKFVMVLFLLWYISWGVSAYIIALQV